MSAVTRRGLVWAGLGVLGAAGLSLGLKAMAGGGDYEVAFLTPAEMKAGGALVVDVRTPEEWQQTGVIEGAKLVTFTDPESFLASIKGELGPNQDLVLVCHSGRRSAAAAGQLASLIPNRIISADGGMSAVIAGGYQTVAPQL